MKTEMLVGSVALALATIASPMRADDILECRIRVERVHEKLERTIEKYGKDSAHALRVQSKLEAVHEWCWRRYKGWWDENQQLWRTDHW